MNKSVVLIVGLVLLASLVLFSTTYTVNFNEVAIRTRFGQTTAESVVDEPGLHFRLPLFIDRVTKLDKRLQLQESPLEFVQTRDGQQVVVRGYLMWQIDTDAEDGPLRLFRSHASMDEANQALMAQFQTALRNGVSRYSFDELLGSQSRLPEVEQSVLSELSSLSAKGVKPVSVGISQMLLPPRTTQAVLTRMQATRMKLSESARIKGNAEADAIEARAATQADKIRSFAMQRAEEIRATGNQAAAEYMQRMGEEEDLAVFLVWLEALRASLSEHTTLIVPTTFAPFHMMQLDTLTDSRGIPVPTGDEAMVATPSNAQATPASGAVARDHDSAQSVEERTDG